jgi:TolA-binding protein
MRNMDVNSCWSTPESQGAKPEIRNPKSEGNSKPEIRKRSACDSRRISGFGFWSFLGISGFGFLVLATGCVDNRAQTSTAPPADLVSASQALATHQPTAAIADSQAFLDNQPTGPMAAQALYFKGRGYEELARSSAADRSSNFLAARSSYLLALQQSPGQKLEADIHTNLAIVDFYMDYFADCIQEASVAMSMMPWNEVRGNLLLHTGFSEQRLGRFTDADQTFRQVEQRYPGTALAQRAQEHEGQDKFYVQVATFDSPTTADQAAQSLRSRNIVVSQRSDAQGHTVIDVGPKPTYAEAKVILEQLKSEFPNAEIVP